MDAAVGQAANWLQIAGAPSDLITIGTTVHDIINDYRKNLPLAVKQAKERVECANTLLQRLVSVSSSGSALQTDYTVWETKLFAAREAQVKHNDDPSWWGAPAAVDALEGVIVDVNGLLDDISRTLHVDAHVHRMQKTQAKIFEQKLHEDLELHSRRTTAGFNVSVESSAPRSTKFRPLALHDAVGSDGAGSCGSTSGDDRAAARRGGYEVSDRAKIRFTISPCQFPENRYFFIITVDRSSEDKLQLYFPQFMADTNSLVPSSFERIFPDKERDEPYFPMTLACTGHNPVAYESITVYMVVTPQVLQKASPAEERIKLEDVAHHVRNAGKNIIVNRFDFDIRNLKS